MKQLSQKLKNKGLTIGFVPTMGALHQGHLSLIKYAKKKSDVVIVSIFVNPLQFGPKEDYKKYPRDLKRDLNLLRKAKVDYVFCPTTKEMFPKGFKSYVKAGKLGNILCGKSRPGHFDGVVTVVARLFQVVKPDLAFFGEKDYQQLIIIKQMVKNLNLDIKVIGCPIVREKDGLAMSSRNAYLNAKERKQATILYKSLQLAKRMVAAGERNAERIKKSMRKLIATQSLVKIDYIEVVDPKTLESKEKIKGKNLVMLAAYVGRTRLIDNQIIYTY